jgi:peptidoglycan/LPS O-acetylase OafA/YrhL
MASVPGRTLYVPALDGMRALAFLLVFFAHSLPYHDLPGGFGVTVFFFLSGYLITTLLRVEASQTSAISLRHFYLRRILRIFPPCYVTVIVVCTLARLGLIYNTESYRSLVAAFLYFSNYWNILGWGNLPAGLGVLWSLAVEEHYYLLYPLLYAWFVRKSLSRGRQAFILGSLCCAALIWRIVRAAVFRSPWANIYEGTDTRFDAILFGCLLAILFNPRLGDSVNWLTRHARALALGGAALLVVTFAWRNPFFRDTFRYTLQSLALAPIFFYVTVDQSSVVSRLLALGPMRWVGQLSYSLYLIHHTLFHHFYHYRRPSMALATAVLVLSIAYAQTMRWLIELPLQKARSRLAQTGAGLAVRTAHGGAAAA